VHLSREIVCLCAGLAQEARKMIHYTCDMCGKPLLVEEEVRYVVKIEVYAGYDPMEITEEDLEEDHTEEMRELVKEMEDMTTEEVEEGVYKKFRFDLCPSCKEIYLRDPLLQKQGRRISFGEN